MTLTPPRPLPAAVRALPDRGEAAVRWAPLDPATEAARPCAPVGRVAEALAGHEPLPSLAEILAHYRRHGTVARMVAAWPAPAASAVPTTTVADLDEPILGLQTRELDSPDLFDQFFGDGR